MNLGISSMNKVMNNTVYTSTMIDVFKKADPKILEKAKKAFPETLRSCKPFKPECEFCKEKIGLLNNDVFTKESKK